MFESVYQHTVKSALTVKGVGVHSGAPATMTIRPGLPNTGLVFVRTDVTGKNNVVPARWDNVTDTKLCTVISNRDGVTVSTIEHVVSALAALGVDNAVIDIDGPEVPIMDGSAIEFVTALDKTGVSRQKVARRVLRIKKEVVFTEGDKEVRLSPEVGTHYAFDLIYDGTLIGRQSFNHEMTEETYRADIASARTFGFLHEVEYLRSIGLARGGSLDNAVVISGDKVLNEGGLRYNNEFVRHKILDAIGDLYLAGARIEGRYHGVKAGHAMNNNILRALFAQKDAYEFVELSPAASMFFFGHSAQVAVHA